MNTFRAIPLTEENLDVIANSGEISREDVQALYESTVESPQGRPRYFIPEYLEVDGTPPGWFAPSVEFFDKHFAWTEPPKTGFRYATKRFPRG